MATVWMVVVLAVFLLLVLGAAALVIGTVTANRLRELAGETAGSWDAVAELSGRRHALVRDLLAVLRQHAVLEKRVVDLVAHDLDTAVRAHTPGGSDRAERRLTSSVRAALAKAAEHPALASAVAPIDAALAELDDQILAAAEEYNADAAELNSTLTGFPGSAVAERSGVGSADLFRPLAG